MRTLRSAGFVTPFTLIVVVAAMGVCGLAYVGLGRLGWAPWLRVVVIFVGGYVLAFGLMFLTAAIERIREKRAGPPTNSP